MCEGYVSDKKVVKQKITELPGYKCIEFIEDAFRVLDAYCVKPCSNVSSGLTTIWHNDMPIWTMNYGGVYPSECISLLKRALSKNYEQGVFRGGRGPFRCRSLENPDLVYFNDMEDDSSFAKFAGYESMVLEGFGEVGFHRYFGMALI